MGIRNSIACVACLVADSVAQSDNERGPAHQSTHSAAPRIFSEVRPSDGLAAVAFWRMCV